LNWWFYRVQGDTRERPFGIYTKSDGFTISGASSWPNPVTGGHMSAYTWTENGAAGPRFTADYSLALMPGNGIVPYTGQLNQTFEITNPNSSPLTISLFNLVLWAPGGNYFSTPVTATGDINSISVTDGLYEDTHTALGATAFQADQGTAFRTSSRTGP
jgi:hypothetical protein